jgi:hypothetical protein
MNQDLSNIEQQMLLDFLDNIVDVTRSCEDDFVHRQSAKKHGDLRAYMGGIRAHIDNVREILTRTDVRECDDPCFRPNCPHHTMSDHSSPEAGQVPVRPEWLYGAGGVMSDTEAAALIEPLGADDANPHGITLSAEFQIARDKIDRGFGALGLLLEGLSSVPDDAHARYARQLEAGVLTTDEYEALMKCYWIERKMVDATTIERIDWLYDHDQLDAQGYWDSLEEAWVEHLIEPDHKPGDPCAMCAFDQAAQYRDAYITSRFPQMTGSSSPVDPGVPG